MDKWKSFFQSSGSDIWTVIDRAITIAAEQPSELRKRRDAYTEKMFCPAAHLAGLCDCPGDEDGDARSRSGGGGGEEEEDGTQHDRDDDEDNVSETKLVVSGGGALREDEEEDLEDEDDDLEEEEEEEEDREEDRRRRRENSVDDDEEEELAAARNRKNSSKVAVDCSYMDVEALSDEMEEESRRIKEINRIKNQILNYLDKEDYVLEALERLESMHISFESLKATEIGKPVDKLRKHSSSKVRSIAARIISEWKSLTDEWRRSAERIAGGSNSNTRGHFDNYGLPSPPVDEGELLAAGTAPLEMNKIIDFIDDDVSAGSGDMNEKPRRGSSGDLVRGIYEDDNSPEETKTVAIRKIDESETRNRHQQASGSSRKDSSKSSDMIKRAGDREVREKVASSQLQNGSRVGSATATATANGKYSSSSGISAARQQQRDEQRQKPATASSNASRAAKPGVATVSRPKPTSSSLPPSSSSKRTVDERIHSSSRFSSSIKAGAPSDKTDKLAAAKRKLQQGYKEAENAKKQRTVQVMELTELPKGKGGPRAAKAVASHSKPQHNNRYNSNHGRR